ncbi:MAG: YhbY family RNA-binding protein [Treponema sp.]|nr:YhbY family RNA-binding protein [Treponema sp.]
MFYMTSSQRKILSSAASNLNPLVIIGQNGLTDGVVQKIAKVIDDHELIKVKFNEFKEEKKDLTNELCSKTGAELVRIIGNIAILYKESSDPDKRKHLI